MEKSLRTSTVAALLAVQSCAVSNLTQEEATANFQELENIESNMSDEMWENLEYVSEDVLASGYWFVICLDIQQAWDVCANIESEPSDIVPEYDCPEVDYEETEE